MKAFTIEHYMTPMPHTIGANQTLSTAHHFMRENRVRHLPVLDSGDLVGIVSQRDLFFIETISGVNPENVLVDEAMTSSPYTVHPRTSVRVVAREMARRKLGCAVVIDDGRVVGIFTVTDAVRLLSELLGERTGETRLTPRREKTPRARRPAQARRRSTRSPATLARGSKGGAT